MTICATVVARDLRAVGAFHLLLGAELGNMAKLPTVAAKRETSVNDLASIVQALEELLAGLGPALNLPGSVGLFNKAIRHSVLLVDVALKVHVGEDLNQGALSGNEPEANVMVDQGLLKLAVGDFAFNALYVLVYGFFGVVNILLGNCLLDLLPGNLRVHIGNVVTVDLARFLAVLSEVAWTSETLVVAAGLTVPEVLGTVKPVVAKASIVG
ncbi:hypothetical protein HG531_007883 [Fusarium graminearum]|nr:hypothetical protein HG531_007883 [Fusarium graminearum]